MQRFSIKMRESATALADMRGLNDLMQMFEKQFHQKTTNYYNTELGEVSRKTEFTLFHSDIDKEKIIEHSVKILKQDDRFCTTTYKLAQKETVKFPRDAAFLKGCIRIQKK